MKLFQDVKDKLIGAVANAVAKSSSWGKLFAIAHENKLFGNTITSPYEQVSNVYKAVKALADNVPQAELAIYNYSTEEKDYESPHAKDIHALLNRPNPLMSRIDFIQAVAGFYTLYNECFIIKANPDNEGMTTGQAAGSQLPKQLWTFNPINFSKVMDGNKQTGWRHTNNTIYTLQEVIHLKDFTPADSGAVVRPTKPIEKLLDINWQALIYNKAFFDNYAQVGLTLTTEKSLNELQFNRLRGWLDKEYKGAGKAFKTAIFEGGLKPNDNSQTHTDMDFIEQLKYCREETLGIWRVPKALFNITDDLNYATFQGQMKAFWLYGIMPVLTKIENALNYNLVSLYDSSLYCKFDISQVPAFKDDLKDNVDVATKLFALGVPFNQINERLALGFDPLPHGDVGYLPFNLMPVDLLGQEPIADDEPIVEDDGEKAMTFTVREKIWKAYINRHVPIENRLKGIVKAHFYQQRRRVLEAVNGKSFSVKGYGPSRLTKALGIDWNDERDQLKKKVKPTVMNAVKEGASFGQESLGRMVDQSLLEVRLMSIVAQRTGSFDNIQRTVEKQLNAILGGLERGETIQQISDNIRHVYNAAANRATTIARTETGCAINSGSFAYYEEVEKESGIPMDKTWITAKDEAVRDQHAILDGDTVPMDACFKNGLRFPNDPDGTAEEIINCRCAYITEMKG